MVCRIRNIKKPLSKARASNKIPAIRYEPGETDVQQIHLRSDPLHQGIVGLLFCYGRGRKLAEFLEAGIHFIHYITGNLWRKDAEIIGYDDK